MFYARTRNTCTGRSPRHGSRTLVTAQGLTPARWGHTSPYGQYMPHPMQCTYHAYANDNAYLKAITFRVIKQCMQTHLLACKNSFLTPYLLPSELA